MSLYDREYSGTAQSSSYYDESLVNFIKTTYKLFAGSLLIATIGAIVGLNFINVVLQMKWILFIAEIALIFALGFVKDKPGINVAVLGGFAFLSGVTLVPLLALVIAQSGLSAVAQALGMSAVVFGVMSLFAIKTKSDLGNMGKMLFWSVIVVLICSLLNVFLFKSSIMQAAIAGISAIIFSLYVAFDTQNIIKGRYDSPIMAAISLYLDFLNIFISILQLIGIFGGNNKE